jgi:hypothetical protein
METDNSSIGSGGQGHFSMSPTPFYYGKPNSIYGVATYSKKTSHPTEPGGIKHMDHVAQNLKGLTVAEKADKGRAAVTAAGTTEGVAILGTPAPQEKADLDTATTALEAVLLDRQQKVDAAEAATRAVNDALAAFELSYGNYCKVADNKCAGSAANIRTLSLDVATKPAPVGDLPAPQGLVATMNEIAGRVDLMCEPVKGARIYIWEVCADPMTEANWQQFEVNTMSKATATGLTSGTKYWFRVAAKGKAQGPWSDPAQKMAP